MIILARKISETINIGEDVEVTVVSIQGGQVRLGITAPKTTRVDRAEIRIRKDMEKQNV
jgi:carbon storage regulator